MTSGEADDDKPIKAIDFSGAKEQVEKTEAKLLVSIFELAKLNLPSALAPTERPAPQLDEDPDTLPAT